MPADRHPYDAHQPKIYDTCPQKFSPLAYRDGVLRSLPRLTSWLLALALLVAACGSDGDSESGADADTTESTTSTTAAASPDDPDAGDTTEVDEPDATTSTTTEAVTTDETTTTSTTPPSTGATGVLAQGTVTTSDGLTSDWSLTATASTLCFEADLSHPDPDIADTAGDGVAACLDPDGGLDQMTSGLSVDVGSVDGEKTIGFLWGRVAPEVISLTIEHAEGSQTALDILAGPTDVKVFAYVVEIDSIPPVQDLDAVSGTQIEGSEPIRDFLRAGPTYPVVTSPPVSAPPDYPVS